MAFVYVVAAVAACAGLLFGYDTGAISGAILFIRSDFGLTPIVVGIVTSVALAGATIGSCAGGWLADRFGRRHVIIGTALLFAVGSILSALSFSIAWLIGSRILIGIATGVASFVAPMYLSEMAPSRIRGSLVSLNQLAVTVGILASYIVDYELSTGGRWRWMFGVGVIPALALLIGMVVIPNSPRWLMLRGRYPEAALALSRIRVKQEIEPEIRETRAALSTASTHWSDLLSATLRMPMLVGIGLAVLQQITGINTVIYYAPTIFQRAGFASSSSSILASLSVGIINVLMTIVSLLLLDRVGRRPLLLVGETGMVLSLISLGVGFALHGSVYVGWITAGSLVTYVGSFAIGLGPVFWLLISEIYPLGVRGLAMSVATVANWVANLVVTLTFPELVSVAGLSATFILYAILGLASLAFTWRFVPETRGKTLEQIERHWRGGGHPRTLQHTA